MPLALFALAVTAFGTETSEVEAAQFVPPERRATAMSVMFSSSTFVAPMRTTDAGARASSMTVLLGILGLGITTGNTVSGRYAGRSPMPSLDVSPAVCVGERAEAAIAR